MLPSPDVSDLRCWAEIDLPALRHNARACLALAGGRCGILAVVKADAYGHGLERVVTALADEVDWFGVANLREAERARHAAGAEVPVLILSPVLPSGRERVVSGRFSASVSSVEEVDAFAAIGERLGIPARLHASADTGMGRMGALPADFPGVVGRVLDSSHCELEGVQTHFPSADEEPDFTRGQIETFATLVDGLELPESCLVHIGNSAGLLGFQERTPFATLVRPGLSLYGISPLPGKGANLAPALSLKTRVSLVRDLPAGVSISYGRTFVTDRPTRAATLAVGYGDGYPRHLSGKGTDVLIHGTRCPLLGRVTMDQVVVDVSGVEDPIAPGDEVVLIGRQGEEEIPTVELAEKAGTIPWEILTGITSRVERVSVGR